MNKKELSMSENKKQQELNTKRFIQAVETLKKEGVIQFDSEIVEALEWNKSILSRVLSGKKLIPLYRYEKFNKVYGIEVNNSKHSEKVDLNKIDAKCDVILSALAEIMAFQKGHTSDKIKSDLIASVNQLIIKKSEG